MNQDTKPQEKADKGRQPDQGQPSPEAAGGEAGYESTATEAPDAPAGEEIAAEVEQRQ